MTREEMDLLITYMLATGDLDPDPAVNDGQFWEWYDSLRSDGSQVDGEGHYKAVLQAARMYRKAYDQGFNDGGVFMARELT